MVVMAITAIGNNPEFSSSGQVAPNIPIVGVSIAYEYAKQRRLVELLLEMAVERQDVELGRLSAADISNDAEIEALGASDEEGNLPVMILHVLT